MKKIVQRNPRIPSRKTRPPMADGGDVIPLSGDAPAPSQPDRDAEARLSDLQRHSSLLAAKLTRAITGFNRALDLVAAERMKGGISIETALDQVQQARREFDAGLAAIDDEYDAKHAPSEGAAS